MRERENWPPGTNEESIVTPDGEKRIVEFPEPTNLQKYAEDKRRKAKKNTEFEEDTAPSHKSIETGKEKEDHEGKIPDTVNERQQRINKERRRERKFKKASQG